VKKIHFIINPAAGTDEPILSIINDVLRETEIEWEVSVSRRVGEVFELVGKHRKNVDIIAVYGGDGSIVEAARALHRHETPLAIIPGGTANVMAKELRLPLQAAEAIRLLVDGRYVIRPIDMGLVNDIPFLIRVNMGLLADMVTEASDELKDRFGQWAYGLTAFKHKDRDPMAFRLLIDGKAVAASGVALTITNAGNVGKTGFSFLPDISVADGYLDILLLDKADIASLLKLTGNIVLQRDSPGLKHWRAKEVDIHLGLETRYLCDDTASEGRDLHIQISPASLNVLIPADQSSLI
jgi:diacylglycerol kinase (ATP)